jgi:hypothetical protein
MVNLEIEQHNSKCWDYTVKNPSSLTDKCSIYKKRILAENAIVYQKQKAADQSVIAANFTPRASFLQRSSINRSMNQSTMLTQRDSITKQRDSCFSDDQTHKSLNRYLNDLKQLKTLSR